MDLSTFFSDVASTLTAAVVVALAAWVYSWFRNSRLERSLTNSIDPNGIGVEYSLIPLSAKFSLQVHNYTNAYIRVRSVFFEAEVGHIELTPKKDLIFQTPLLNEVFKPNFRKVQVSKATLEDDGNVHSMLLPPKTMGIWEVWPGVFDQVEWKLRKGFVVFEYGTVFGNLAMIRMQMKDSSFKSIRETFEELNRCYKERRQYDPLARYKMPATAVAATDVRS